LAKEYIYLTGKFKWCRPDAPDPWGSWKTQFFPSAESLEVIRDLQGKGLKNVLSKNDDGEWFTTFRRPTQKVYKGKVIGFAPPEKLDGTKKLPDGTFAPLRDVNIGDGSDGVIKLEVYQHGVPGTDKKAVAARWEAVRIDNLVPFEGRADFDPTAEKQVRGLDEVPPQPLF
jgi:hypothetical protein